MSNKKNFVIDGNIIGFGIESDYKQIKSFQDSLQIEEKEENNENEDDNEYENNYYENENNDNDNIKEEVPPMMSMQFYSDVDIFLNRPPPKIKGITNNKSKIREKLEENIIKSTSLPIILTQQKQTKKIESKINTGRKGPGKKIERHIDQSLLQQAFEYTEKIQREAIENNINEIRETIPKKKSNSAPHNLSNRSKDVNSQDYSKQYNVYTNGDNYDDDEDYNDDEDNYDDEQNEVHSHDHHYQQKNKNKNIKTNSNSNSKSKNKKSGNLVKRLRSQTYTHQDQSDNKKSSSSSSSFDTSLAVGDGGSQRQQVNYDDLIANFEQGITLKLLKKELEESKLSLERSNKAVEQISKEMSAKMRF